MAFPRRTRQTLHLEAGSLHAAADIAFGAVGNQYGSVGSMGIKLFVKRLAPHFRLLFRRKSIHINQVDVGRKGTLVAVAFYFVQDESV